MHSGTGNVSSFPVIQDTHSQCIPDIMPLGSLCGKLWVGVFKGGAKVGACRTGHGNLTAVDVWWCPSSSSSSQAGHVEQAWRIWSWRSPCRLNLSRRESVCQRILEVCDKAVLHENFGRTLSALIPHSGGRVFSAAGIISLLVAIRVERCTMAGVNRKGSGRPSYYYRFLGKSRLQRQRSRSRSRTRPSTSRGNKYFYNKRKLPKQQFKFCLDDKMWNVK